MWFYVVITYFTFIDEVKMEIDDEKSPEKDQLVKEEPMTTDSNCNDEQQPCVEVK